MTESAALKFLNKRIAKLVRQRETLTNPPRRIILEELSELAVIRDELRKIQQEAAAEANRQISPHLPKEFPSVSALVHRLNSIAKQIVNTQKTDRRRPELLNEMTRLCLVADSLYKREL